MKHNSLFLFVSLCNSLPRTHSAVVTLDLLNGRGPVQEQKFHTNLLCGRLFKPLCHKGMHTPGLLFSLKGLH